TWYDERQSHDDRPVAPSLSESQRYSVHSGSRWRITVKLRPPRGLRNPGGFDSEKQALADRIAATGYLRDTAEARELTPPYGIDAWRERMSARMAVAITRPS